MDYLLHHLLARSAHDYGDKDAVVHGAEKIAYRELNELSNKLASVLREGGVRRGDRVAIYINKSIPSIVFIHGILKCGAVYVPLDANAPLGRLAYMIRNAGIECLLTSAKFAARLPEMFLEDNPLKMVVLADDFDDLGEKPPMRIIPWEQVLDHRETQPQGDSAVETDLAYILYTSGSTGAPKGVMISHLNALTFVNWAHDTFKVSSEDRLSSHAPFHFDLSIFDLFAAFKAGATVVLVPEGASTFPIRLADWIENNQISIWYSVPSVLSMMVMRGQLDRYRYPNLRTVLFAGEVFPIKYLRELMRKVPHPEYYNLYGPTETNVVTYYKVPKLPSQRVKPIPIGKACANTEVFALTEDGKPVTGPGQEGELYARGSCVARGYWDDSELSNRNFVVNHTQLHFQELMYKTGDLVTMDEKGNYVYLGRRDQMVKSRGYRIELGEIEAALYSCPAVTEAAAVAIPDEMIGNRIKAFVVLNKNGRQMDSRELQKYCAGRIPAYMVPETIELRESLPKTSTGKVDKVELTA